MSTETQALRQIVETTWNAALDDHDDVDVAVVARRVVDENSDLVEQIADEAALALIVRFIKDLARAETEQGSQLSLFGFPAVIAVPIPDDGYLYKRTTKARWPELVAGRGVRETNVRRAQERLDQYDDGLEQVRSLMEGSERTFAEALTLLQPDAVA